MCGIAGAFVPDDRVSLGRLREMSRLLRHRGPDDEGLVVIDPRDGRALALGGPDTPADVLASTLRYAPGSVVSADGGNGRDEPRYSVGLLSRRLAIVDLSPSGHQPMCDASGRHWIAFNGEIYNHVELRAELEQAGERFISTSDTEVILAAYRRFGHACLERMNGMFAFALWDGERREMFCARDRFGIKPLYYQWRDGVFAFASEPKALILTQTEPLRPRMLAVRDLLALDWVDHESQTFFEGLWQLPAAHALVIGARDSRLWRWWSLDPSRHAAGTPSEWEERFKQLFGDAVALRLRADVDVGSCLSGGTDSGAVVVTASRQLDHPMHAFTCAYDAGPEFDERPHVRAIVEASGAKSHTVVPDGGDFWSVFDALTASQDEPTAGPGLYSQWKVMELAHRAGLKVLLDGQGGDETLGGYFRYLPIRLRDLLGAGRIPQALAMWRGVASRLGTVTACGAVAEPWVPPGLTAALRRRFGQGKDRVLTGVLRHLAHRRADSLPRPPRTFNTGLRRQLAFDTLQRLLPSLLRYEDRNSMAFSIETRLPFLDYRLVEFVFLLPDDQIIEGTTTKAILRRALADVVPASVLARRDKMGFETPTDLWWRGGFGHEVRRRLLGPTPVHEWLDPRVLEVELDDYLAGRREIGLQVWRWLSLDSWMRNFVAHDPRIHSRMPDVLPHHGRGRSLADATRENERALLLGIRARS